MKHRAGLCSLLIALALAAPAPASELRPWIGGTTPPLELKDTAGQLHRLSDYRGKVVLINFWATWCEPCRDEMPALQQLRDKLAGQGLVVLAVDAGEFAERIDAFLKKSGLDLTVLRDHSGEAMKNWRVKGLPASFVVAPDGRVRYRVDGEFNWADDNVAATLTKLAASATSSGSRKPD